MNPKRWPQILVILVLGAGLGLALGACQGVDGPSYSTRLPIIPVATQVSPKDEMVQVFVPEGDFLMGTSDEEAAQLCSQFGNPHYCVNWYTDEKPQHIVWLDAFWIDRSEVTNAQYAKCVENGDCQEPDTKSPSSSEYYYFASQYADYPVTYVNWDMAAAYCKWAGRRLPTEAEWEKAARGSDGRLYPWGNDAPACSLANYLAGGNTCAGSQISMVGSHPEDASPYGAFDMAGSVWEWMADRYSAGYVESSSVRNPTGSENGESRVLRGGAWDFFTWGLGSAYRNWYNPAEAIYNFGIRCAASP
jgi:formylglycine-generating enzyme required for sulfatase activity